MYSKRIYASGCTREITYFDKEKEIGSFSMGSRPTDQFIGNTVDMSIYIEDTHLGTGLSRKMMCDLFKHVIDEIGFPNCTIYIDTDASAGFWDHIGMVPNIDYDTPDTIGRGYEKCIEFEKLYAWASMANMHQLESKMEDTNP
jgi:hypothetical protein